MGHLFDLVASGVEERDGEPTVFQPVHDGRPGGAGTPDDEGAGGGEGGHAHRTVGDTGAVGGQVTRGPSGE